MGAFARHFKALNKKNWINWKRTMAGSIAELICPIALLLILVVLRREIQRETIDNIDLMKMRHGLYPATKYDPLKKKYDLSFDNIADQSEELADFMLKGNISTNDAQSEYIPMLDGRGPMMFFPPHCVPLPDHNVFGSPIVAYIKSESKVQGQMVEQLEAFFQNQIGLWDLIQKNEFLREYVAEYRNVKKTPEQIQAEKEENAATAQTDMLSGAHRSADQTFFPNIDFRLVEYDSVEEMEAAIKDPLHGRRKEKPGICFGFTIHEHSDTSYELELFFNDIFVLEYKSLPSQALPAISAYQMQPQVREYAYYSYYGFGYMQNWAANTILRFVTEEDDAQIVAMTVPMKIPPMMKDPFAFMLSMLSPYFFMLMYIPMVYRTTYRIVQEKELRVREIMRMMGMSDASYWASWFLYHTMISTAISCIAYLLAGYGIFSFSDPTLIWAVFWLYGQAIFGLILFIQSFFQQARTAAVTAIIFYLGCSAVEAGGEKSTYVGNIILSIFPTTCMTAMVKVVLGFEQNALGVGWDSTTLDYKKYTVLTGLIMMVVSFSFWTLLGLYFEQVLPREFGRRQSVCFCMPRFCCTLSYDDDDEMSFENDGSDVGTQEKEQLRLEGNEEEVANLTEINREFETNYMPKDAYEPVVPEVAKLEHSNNFMRIKDLQKTYDTGFKAVRGINLKLYMDQIFVLLGHNGAGKTSTIQLLTGLYTPTQGEAECFGVNMFEEADQLRQFMGICPQHDVLFDLLTPAEHMDIFYDFKCLKPVGHHAKHAEINKLLKDVGVDDKRDDLAGQLSGGNQRKLSVAIALCGGSKFVVFDEPTAGMDLSARRQTWNMLKEYKKDRIILLTTHYMDEADILADRIGILTAGRLSCLGTSMFLKKKYGVGYNLTAIKKTTANNQLVMPYFKSHMGAECKKLSEIQSEMTIQIPHEYSGNFKQFFATFDKQLEDLQLDSYGISITTLEDVFMKVGHIEDPSQAIQHELKEDDENQHSQILSEGSGGGGHNFYSEQKKRRSTNYRNKENIEDSGLRNEKSRAMDGTADGLDVSDMQTLQFMQNQQRSRSISSKKQSDEEERDDDVKERVSDEVEEKPSDKIQDSDQDQPPVHDPKSDTEEDFAQDEFEGGELASGKSSRRPSNLSPRDNPSQRSKTTLSPSRHSKNRSQRTGSKKSLNSKKVWNLSESRTNDSCCNSFQAVVKKRSLLYWNSKRYVFFDMLLPAILMCLGIWTTTFSFFARSPSRVLGPERMGYPNEMIIFDRAVQKTGNETMVQDLINYMPNQTDFFDMRITEESMGFDEFDKFIYKYGQKHATELPYFYSGYKIYDANPITHKYQFYNFLNMTNQDGGGLYPQFMYEAILKRATRNKNFQFKVRSTPFPTTEQIMDRKNGANTATIAFITGIAYSMILTTICGSMVHERVTRLKHIQIISGVQLPAYWLGNFLVDLAKMEFTSLVTMIIFEVSGLAFTEAAIVYLLYPFGTLPFTYVTAFIFPSVASAQTFTIFSHFFFITGAPCLVFYLRFLKPVFALSEFLNLALKIVPSFGLGEALFFNGLGGQLVEFRTAPSGKGFRLTGDPWTIENISGTLIGIGFNFVFWTLILICIEQDIGKKSKKCRLVCNKRRLAWPKPSLEIDPDVTAEAKRVAETHDRQLQIKVSNLRKVYMRSSGPCNPGKPLCAVENLSFGLSKGECFALLGVNGAGKSTTFKVLTNEEDTTSGSIKIQGMDMAKNFQKVRKLIGYCPQYNPIFDTLTVAQNIEYFARIKGIPGFCRGKMITDAIQQLDLETHKSKMAGTLSGGNKRKLSVAIAIVGNPAIILLDEPSAGMDPEARRFMWEVVGKIASNKTSAVILTSHLMEEAEALSTKMGIMVKGGIFKCFGSSQHIKNKFGKGFEVELKVAIPIHKDLIIMCQQELDSTDATLNIGATLKRLPLSRLEQDQIRHELYLSFRQASVPLPNIHMLEDPNFMNRNDGDVRCPAVVFMEKLFTVRNLFGSIKAVCQEFGRLEVLEQYGNYIRLRVSNQEKTIGQMFGMVDELKKGFHIDNYSISQTTLEQIFQSFANLNFDAQVKIFEVEGDTLVQL